MVSIISTITVVREVVGLTMAGLGGASIAQKRQITDLMRQSQPLPATMWYGFYCINAVHHLWRSYRIPKIRKVPTTFLEGVGRWAVERVVNESQTVRLLAQCVLIANRISACMEKKEDVIRVYKRLASDIKGDFRESPSKWKSLDQLNVQPFVLDPGIEKLWWTVSTWVKNVVRGVFHLLKETFALSMFVLDAVESFYVNPTEQDEPIQDLFDRAMNVQEGILKSAEEQQKELCIRLIEQREIVDSVLKKQGSTATVATLTRYLHGTMQATRVTGDIAAVGNAVVSDGLGVVDLVTGSKSESPSWRLRPTLSAIKERVCPTRALTTDQILKRWQERES